MISYLDVKNILNECQFLDRSWKIHLKGDGFLIQMVYNEADTETGKMEEQCTRKWYVSSNATESEVVQTALKCVLTSQEHIGREHFKYKGENIFYPHWNLDDLVELRKHSKEQRR